jgi:hypothetical protein
VALTYNTLLRQLALTTNSLGGATTPAMLNSTYDTVPLTEMNFSVATGSSIFSFGFLKDKLLNSQEGLFLALASTSTNPLRRVVESQTDSLAYAAQITTNAAGLPVVGAYGTVYDAESNEPCTLNELEDIRSRHLNPNSMFILPVYEYAFLGDRVYHTREEVIIDVCGYERPDADALDLESTIILPDILGPAMVQGAIAECYRDDEYLPQAARAGEFYQAWIKALQSGMARIEPQSNPTPDAQKEYAAA